MMKPGWELLSHTPMHRCNIEGIHTYIHSNIVHSIHSLQNNYLAGPPPQSLGSESEFESRVGF
jgi:hypothetical protein